MTTLEDHRHDRNDDPRPAPRRRALALAAAIGLTALGTIAMSQGTSTAAPTPPTVPQTPPCHPVVCNPAAYARTTTRPFDADLFHPVSAQSRFKENNLPVTTGGQVVYWALSCDDGYTSGIARGSVAPGTWHTGAVLRPATGNSTHVTCTATQWLRHGWSTSWWVDPVVYSTATFVNEKG